MLEKRGLGINLTAMVVHGNWLSSLRQFGLLWLYVYPRSCRFNFLPLLVQGTNVVNPYLTLVGCPGGFRFSVVQLALRFYPPTLRFHFPALLV